MARTKKKTKVFNPEDFRHCKFCLSPMRKKGKVGSSHRLYHCLECDTHWTWLDKPVIQLPSANPLSFDGDGYDSTTMMNDPYSQTNGRLFWAGRSGYHMFVQANNDIDFITISESPPRDWKGSAFIYVMEQYELKPIYRWHRKRLEWVRIDYANEWYLGENSKWEKGEQVD